MSNMSNNDLIVEFELACAAMRDIHYARLRALGVGREAYIFAKPLALPAPIGVERVEIDSKSRTYQPVDHHGAGMFVQPLHDNLGVLIDLVCWHPDRPSTRFLRRDIAPVLGAEAVEEAAFFGDVLDVYAMNTAENLLARMLWQHSPIFPCRTCIGLPRDITTPSSTRIQRKTTRIF